MPYYYFDDITLPAGDIRNLTIYEYVLVGDAAYLVAQGGHVFTLAGYGRIAIDGQVFATQQAIQALGSFGGSDIRISARGSVRSPYSAAILLDGLGNVVTNAGLIDGYYGVQILGGRGLVDNTGDIVATGTAIEFDGVGAAGGTLANAGTILSVAGTAIQLRGTGVSSVVNSGSIIALDDVAINLGTPDGQLSVINTGLIRSSTIAVYGFSAVDVVRNSGTILGTIELLAGADEYDGTGGSVSGVVNGSGGDDVLIGGALRDRFLGGADDDELNGAGGDDLLDGAAGTDLLFGGDGNDVLIGGFGPDEIDGGAGRDIAAFSAAVILDLFDPTANTGEAAGDVYSAIEAFRGGANADRFFGASLADTFEGGAGADLLVGRDGNDTLNGGADADTLIGGTGNDRLIGGPGIDTASYAGGAAAVRIDLGLAGWQNTLGGGIDVLVGIENLVGGDGNDVLTGDVLDNRLDGGNGNDQVFGDYGDDVLVGGAGDDRMNGGSGSDTADYSATLLAVTVSLANPLAQATGGAGSDTLTLIENLTGTAANDVLTGATGDNVLQGGLGDDQLNGGAGIDTADYSSSASRVVVKLAVLVAQNTLGAGIDTLAGIENITGSAFDDQLTGDAVANSFEGGAGNDTIVGGGSVDTVTYRTATSAVAIDLAVVGIAQYTGGAGSDTLFTVESAVGSDFNDILSGSSANNRLDGGLGDDILSGLDGNDSLVGGIGYGTDILLGGTGTDTLYGGDGADTLNGGADFDTASFAGLAGGFDIYFDLVTPIALDQFGYMDQLIDIEAVVGSSFSDSFNAGIPAHSYTGGGGADRFRFGAGRATGDAITDFSGAAGQSDTLQFSGYGAGATFTQIDATHWKVANFDSTLIEVITFANAPAIAPGDVFFV